MKKERNNQKRKGLIPLIAILALFLIAGIAGGTYAYWAGSVNAPANKDDNQISINVGQGKAVDTVINLAQINDKGSNVLVPAAQVDNSDTGAGTPVGKITYTYTVNWDEVAGDATGTQGNLSVTKKSVTVGDNTNDAISDHVVVTINAPATITMGTAATVTVEITLTEPANKTNYDLIANQPISVTLEFDITLIP